MDIPSSTMDLYSDENLLNPYDGYEELRNAGPIVWLDKLQMYVVARFAQVREVLATPSVFVSREGVMMNQDMNNALKGIVLCSDGEEHAVMRRVLMKPVMPSALRQLRSKIDSEAETLVERLVAKKSFNAATELAQHLPLTIVSNLVGLPEEGRSKMLEWAEANFNCFGPMNARTVESFDTLKDMVNYAVTQCVRGKLKPGGWAEMLHDAGDRGEISPEKSRLMAIDYVAPALDTTIFAISSAIWLFAQHPEQWDLLRENPTLLPNAINEVLRLESPIQGFSRFASTDYCFEQCKIPARSRVIVLYGAGNRDERQFADPTRFDITRENVADHMAFGHGEHACVGMNLARMEIGALLTALAKRVNRFELGTTERVLNNTLRGFRKVEVRVLQ